MKFIWSKNLLCGFSWFALCLSVCGNPTNALTEEQRLNISFEALSRLEGINLEKNPQLKTAIENLLTKTRGTAQFVQIVKQLKLKNQDAGLLEVATRNPANESGVAAIRLILANGNVDLLTNALQGSDAIKAVEVLGNSGKKEAVPLLMEIVTDAKRDLPLRKQAVRSAAQIQEGAEQLLNLANEGTLANDLKLITSAELNNVRWEPIKTEAAKVLPLEQGKDAKPLPSMAELLKKKGNAMKGEKIFFNTETACGSCHQIKGRGMEIGPGLSEIGDKLGKEALLESILEPSAGISFGYEAHQVELKSGDETYGLIVSETDDELVMKDLKGIVARYKKSDVAKRQQMKTSIMPTGLAQTMSAQELVDLVEFLSTLRKGN